jgi:hypothetical protein
MHEIKHKNVMVLGINNNFQQLFHTFPLCEGCVVGKQPQKIPTFLENDFETKVVFELIHLNKCGPMEIKYLNGFVYFATSIDDYS